jgi:D-alanine transaminase
MGISYVNGRYLYRSIASISIEDRGFNFSDGIYEVMAFSKNKIFNYEKHIKRLKRSLKEIKIPLPFYNLNTLKIIIKKLISFNSYNCGIIYLQITRGSSIRNHLFPENINLNIVINIYPQKDVLNIKKGVDVITAPDLRWKRCDIKSISLLANVLGKQKAFDLGVYELWLTYNKDIISEGTTSNCFIVKNNNTILTHPKNNKILGGVTRDSVIEIARKNKINVFEKEFTVNQVYKCKEAFLTSTTVGILPVKKIDNYLINKSLIGPITVKLMKLYESFLKQ